MEKIIHRISFVITAVLVYVLASYSYLSLKGFRYNDGTFELISRAQAQQASEDVPVEQPFAVRLPDDVALHFPQKTMFGQDDAPLTIYEFSSLGCTHCADFHLNTLPKLEKEYIEPGKVRVVFVHFPLDRGSMQAAMLSECLQGEEKTGFINQAFTKQREWLLSVEPQNALVRYAQQQGLGIKETAKCLKNDDNAKEILANRQEAIDKLHIEGTPAFLVSGADGNEIIFGAPETKRLKAYLNTRLYEESNEENK